MKSSVFLMLTEVLIRDDGRRSDTLSKGFAPHFAPPFPSFGLFEAAASGFLPAAWFVAQQQPKRQAEAVVKEFRVF
ncbi:hypothetical protein KJI95_02040 [Shewanella sp. JM162201]|uniref:Uncharacterized protein n=2 Tax=Shewanella jiangmenensis TaxID=2837387 RepID=A0ABS5UYV4_9GAMM|nr:hypothetical protein [Shewanella jiangmenensis]